MYISAGRVMLRTIRISEHILSTNVILYTALTIVMEILVIKINDPNNNMLRYHY